MIDGIKVALVVRCFCGNEGQGELMFTDVGMLILKESLIDLPDGWSIQRHTWSGDFEEQIVCDKHKEDYNYG